MLLIAGDAKVRDVTPLEPGTFRITRPDGSSFTARVVSGRTSDDNPAEIELTGPDRGTIRVSPKARLDIIERAVASAVAQLSARLAGNQAEDVLTASRHPGDQLELSATDEGRQAEVRNLARAKAELARLRVLRRLRTNSEWSALVEDIGAHQDADGGPQRQALTDADVRALLTENAGRRPSWTKPPSGFPTWKSWPSVFIPAVTPGLLAAAAIAATGKPLIGANFALMTVGTATAYTIAKLWYGKRQFALLEAGHEYLGKMRAWERTVLLKPMLNALLARARTTGINFSIPGPAEPPPPGDLGSGVQPYLARLLYRGVPAVVGALAASPMLAVVGDSLPIWNAMMPAGLAGLAALFGPVAEKYLHSRLAPYEWHLVDNVDREQDRTTAEFDRLFVARLHALMDRLDQLAGAVSPPAHHRTRDPLPEGPVESIGVHRFVGPGPAGAFVFHGVNAVQKVGQEAANLWSTGGVRSIAGILVTAYLDYQYIRAEYKEIIKQVNFDFGNKMAEQIGLAEQTLLALLAEAERELADAEAAQRRVQESLPSRVAHLEASQPTMSSLPAAPAPADPNDRPSGFQSLRAFQALALKQAVAFHGVLIASAITFDLGGKPIIVIGAYAAGIAATALHRYRFRRDEQYAADSVHDADRAKGRTVEAAQAEAIGKFVREFIRREVAAALLSDPASGPHSGPRPHVPPILRWSDLAPIEAVLEYERERMFHEPRPWSLLGARLVALDRLDRLANRLRLFAAHETRTGRSEPVNQAEEDLAQAWNDYQRMLMDGTPMPKDHELADLTPRQRPDHDPPRARAGETARSPDDQQDDEYDLSDPTNPRLALSRRLWKFFDQSIKTSAGRAFYERRDTEMRSAAKDVPRLPGWYTVDIHGGLEAVYIGDNRLTVDDLARLIEADPRWQRKPIVLFSCHTGRSVNGVAQKLADRLGVEVSAPSAFASSTADGETFVSSGVVDRYGKVELNDPPDGEWRSFTPAGVDLGAMERLFDFETDQPPQSSEGPSHPRAAGPDDGTQRDADGPIHQPASRPALPGYLQGYFDLSVATEAGRAFYADQHAEMRTRADWVPREPGMYTIDIHGDANWVYIGDKRLSADELAMLIEADPTWHGQPIRLFSCDAGKNSNGFAARLADCLGVPVSAPTELVKAYESGLVIVSSGYVNKDGQIDGSFPLDGKWRTFPIDNNPEHTVETDQSQETEQTARFPEGPYHPRAASRDDDSRPEDDSQDGNQRVARPPMAKGFYAPDGDDLPALDPVELEPDRPLPDVAAHLAKYAPVYAGDDRLWPDELADIIMDSPDWTGGPVRLLVRAGRLDAEFVQRLADLIGAEVGVPSKSVVDGFPRFSSGTLGVYNETGMAPPPDDAWRVVRPTTGRGLGTFTESGRKTQ